MSDRKKKLAAFNDDKILRSDLPRDVFKILHDLCYHICSKDIRDYVRRARAALRRRPVRASPWPRQHEWLMRTLRRAYPDKSMVLSMFGDIARLIQGRKRGKRESSTTCIACGAWIPREREERRQHTCSEACQDWYKRLCRAMLAARYCRYCNRPKGHPDALKFQKRPKPRKLIPEPLKKAGSGSHKRILMRIDSDPVPLVPTARDGVPKDALEEALEARME